MGRSERPIKLGDSSYSPKRAGVSLRVLISVGERVRAQTFGQGPQDRFKLRQNEVTSHGQLGC